MKKYYFLFALLFLLLCWPAALAAQQDEINLAEYIDSLPIESTTELKLEIGFTDDEVPSNIARLVNLKTINISANHSMHTREYKDTLESGLELSKVPEYNRQILLPPELFALPSLEELDLHGLARYRLKSPLQVDELKMNIHKLSIRSPHKETIDFWPIFQNLEELEIYGSTVPELNEAIYRLKKLRKLSIKLNAATIYFDERLNGLRKLESIDLWGSSVVWPKDMSDLSNLKKISTEYCGYAPELISGRKYYFPSGIHSLPNLESLYMLAYSRLELPPRATGLHNLKFLGVLLPQNEDLWDRYYLPCQPNHPILMDAVFAPDVLNIAQHTEKNLNNITDYSSLEEITIETEDIRKDFGLARKIKAAYHARKIPNLKVLYFMGPEGYRWAAFRLPGVYDGETRGAVDNIDRWEREWLQD